MLKDILPDGKITNVRIQNVTKDYLKNATPNKGVFTYAAGYQMGSHRKEVEVGKWLYDTLGGDITLLRESVECNKKTSDFLWNGKSWELKKVLSDRFKRVGIDEIDIIILSQGVLKEILKNCLTYC